MHSNIMAAGSKDHLPMLATGRYAEWQSRFLRYIDTRPNGDALRKCILEGPYKLTTVTIPAVPATNDTPAVPERTAIETLLTMSSKNKAHYESEKEEIHLLLTGIGDEIYSTVDACKTAHEMWIAIERLQQGEYLNIQDVKTNLYWEFGKFTSHDGESMESYYSRFYKMMNEMIRNNLKVATMQVNVQFLQQLQPEWSRKPKRVKDSTYHKEKMLLWKQANKGVPLQAEQADWLEDTYAKIDEQESEAHSSFMEKIQEVPIADSGTDTEPLEQVQYDAEYNVFANERQHSKQPESISNIFVVEKTDLETYKTLNDRTVDYDKLEHKLNETLGLLAQKEIDIKEEVIHKTNVSRPQLKSTQMKDKVMPNNSQVKEKKTEVEDHPRISSISNKTKSITTCNDSLKSRTSNVNVVCVTCGKCVFNSNHDACVSKFLNDVNARTKNPKVAPISTRQPKSQANKYVAIPPKKTVASESTIQKSKGYYRMLYEKTIESIHLRFNEIKEMIETSIDNNTSGLVLQRQKASDYENSSPVPQVPHVSPSADTTVPSQQELDLLFEQVRGNPFKPVQTRRQLAIDPEICMFTLTMSIAKPKTIKKAMTDSAWIEAMQEELYQFERLQVWELVDKPFGKNIIKLKWLWKNKNDEDQTVIHNKARIMAKGYAQEEGIDFEESFA
nr:Gag-Pol polyprotein [Tanacetum cinerariifolium]